MATRSQKPPRLSKSNWLDHGLKILAASGANALKAEPLCRSLQVSRGSFYWHFRDIGAFHSELLARWRVRATDDIIEDVDQKGDSSERLELLMNKAMGHEDRLERAIRSWAAQNADVAVAVAEIDKIRLDYVCQLLEAAGVPADRVQARAAFIYWANLGRNMMVKGPNQLDAKELGAMAKLFQS
ncbi:MAG: TetR/AcrR family transcriptional regulator [Rhizobiales bacterium]|nr:TetR/AcrR family transcriptional regulator [Hyphomicrobiales bacterium]